MGNARWSADTYRSYSRTTASKSRDEIFQQREIHPDLDPSKIKFRESVDSEANPQSTPIILASDVTGSMGMLAEQIAKHGLGTIMEHIYDRKPVTDPHICCMATGDAYVDSAPLQVTQFEADVTAATSQLEKIYIESGGGGNGGETYSLAWWFAAYKCYTDCFQKRKRKGYLFTIGDECCLPEIKKEHVKRFLGVNSEVDINAKDLLNEVQKAWHVFHLIVEPHYVQPVIPSWKALLNERAIVVADHNKLAEGIVSLIQLVEGSDVDEVVNSWGDKDTALVVQDAARQLTAQA